MDAYVKVGHERGEHIFVVELDPEPTWQIKDTSFWCARDYIQGLDAGWEMGDKIRVYYEVGEMWQVARNMTKNNSLMVRPQ